MPPSRTASSRGPDAERTRLGVLPLGNVVEGLGELVRTESLLVEEHVGDAMQRVDVGCQDLAGLLTGLEDQLPHLFVDERATSFE